MDTIDSFGSRFVIYAIMMLMIIAALILIGLALGSFVNALMWRLHEQEIESVKKKTKKRTEYLKDLSITKGRSMCTHCHHQLAPKDLIPVVSWASLRGKCRYCKQPIADTPLAELLTPLLFVVSYYYWPVLLHGYGLISFLFWLPCIVGFVALSIYDIRWYLLPNRIVYPLFLLAIATTIIHIIFYRGGTAAFTSAVWGILIGGGIFYLLFQVSRGKWIGGGDVKLGALLGCLLGGPLMSILLLFGSSLLGSAFSIPLLASGKMKRTTHVPFGPFLILAAIIIKLFGQSIVTYLQTRAILPNT